jgi:hypothetical protein
VGFAQTSVAESVRVITSGTAVEEVFAGGENLALELTEC